MIGLFFFLALLLVIFVGLVYFVLDFRYIKFFYGLQKEENTITTIFFRNY